MLFELYQDAFKSMSGVSVLREPTGSRSNYWLQTILLDSKKISARNQILERTNEIGISTRPAWDLLTTLRPYKDFLSMDLVQATELASRVVNLPSSPQLAKAKR